MKKVLLAFAILGFVACNNEGDKTPSADSTATVPAVVDSVAAVVDSAASAVVDSAKAAVDSVVK